jgi:NAD(P)-binding Rossmann-like domain
VLEQTDYLVVGAGASGLAFADSLLAEAADVEVAIVDSRSGPGGHWSDAYPFVRLHTPSSYYGVNSLALGEDEIDRDGENAGYYERATGQEVREHFTASAGRLTDTGRVRLLAGHEHLGGDDAGERIRNVESGAMTRLKVRRKVVDARYLEGSIPATHTRPFDVASGARCVPVNELPAVADGSISYTVIGSGKTAADACMWLLANGTEPDRIRWVRPREAWFYDRRHFQPLAQVGAIVEGLALDAEAGAAATSVENLLERLEGSGRLLRIDPSRPAATYRGTMLSSPELQALRQIQDVVRLGHVRCIEPSRILLTDGEIETGRPTLHIDCTAFGLSDAPATRVFQPGSIVLQQIRQLSPCFNAALIGFIEARRDDDEDKNRLCPPNPYPQRFEDWPRMTATTWRAEGRWLREPDVSEWIAGSRLNLLGALPDHAAEPSVQGPLERYLANVGPATRQLEALDLPDERELHAHNGMN